MRVIAGGTPVSLAVTALDGVVVARSAFESSLHYRSAVFFGRFAIVDDPEKERALEILTEALIPGRGAELRAPTPRELAATVVLEMPIGQWSLKVSDGWPDDVPEDVSGPAWAGVVPIGHQHGPAMPAPDLADGIAVPKSVRDLVQES